LGRRRPRGSDVCQIAPTRRDPDLIGQPYRHLREDEILRLFCHHRDRGDFARARDLWEQLALRNFDRVAQLVKVFRFPAGERLAADDRPDATQEAFLRVISMGAGFREAALGQFRAALRQCVNNSCMDFGRKELRHQKHAGGSLDERYEDNDEASPYDAAIARHSREREAFAAEDLADDERLGEQTELVAWAIAQIENDNYREALHMTILEGLAADQIAERLNINLDNVYARRSRGMKQLEKILRDHGS
jgi:RNA polymerase sigma factor (sigma-70 family)